VEFLELPPELLFLEDFCLFERLLLLVISQVVSEGGGKRQANPGVFNHPTESHESAQLLKPKLHIRANPERTVERQAAAVMHAGVALVVARLGGHAAEPTVAKQQAPPHVAIHTLLPHPPIQCAKKRHVPKE